MTTRVTINRAAKPAPPWAVALAKLTQLEATVSEGTRKSLEARWRFGRELASRRVDYKGKHVIPADLKTLVMEQCRVSNSELQKRVKFAERYPTKELMCNAVTHYPSWHQLTKEGLNDKSKAKPKAKAVKVRTDPKWIVAKLKQQLVTAFTHHATLTRNQVADLEDLHATLAAILARLDQNDAEKADRAS